MPRPAEHLPLTKMGEFLTENLVLFDGNRRMTNAEVAALFGIKSPNMVSMWKQGVTPMAIKWLPKLADLINTYGRAPKKIDVMSDLMPLWFETELGKGHEISNAYQRLLKAAA